MFAAWGGHLAPRRLANGIYIIFFIIFVMYTLSWRVLKPGPLHQAPFDRENVTL